MKALLKTWFSVVLSFVGIATIQSPTVSVPLPVFAQPIVVRKAVPTVIRQEEFNSAPLHASARSYTYVFAGKALQNGLPIPNTQVEVRLTANTETLIRKTVTQDDGSYNISIALTAEPRQNLIWEVSALTQELNKAETTGHQILTDEPTIHLNAPLTFIAS